MQQGVKHSIKHNGSYFLTTTIVEWLHILREDKYKQIIIGSLQYCIRSKGLNVFSYVIMDNHMHMIANCTEPHQLKDTIRDLKRFTSKRIVAELLTSNDAASKEMLEAFKKAGKADKKNKCYKVWQTGNHALELITERFTWQKVSYIHNNPVRAGLVSQPHGYLYSSAQNYYDHEHPMLSDVHCLPGMLQRI